MSGLALNTLNMCRAEMALLSLVGKVFRLTISSGAIVYLLDADDRTFNLFLIVSSAARFRAEWTAPVALFSVVQFG